MVNKPPWAALSCLEEMLVTSASALIKMRRTIAPSLTLGFIHLFALQLVLFPALAEARPGSRAQDKEPLGSLSSVGQVYVGNSVVSSESTIFAGDALRTDAMATATFTVSGKGSYEIASRSQLAFVGSQQYIAELKSGIVVMSSVSGTSGINLRIGNFIVVAVTQGEQSTSKIESVSDGSFLISCSEGSVGIVPLEGAPNGIFLQTGQSATISPQGELSAPTATVASSTVSDTAQPPKSPTVRNSHTGWIILGVAAGGGAAAAAALAGHKSSASVSTSSP